MSWITKNLTARATLWTVSGVDNSGDPTFAAPRTIKVRWEEKNASFTNAAGEEGLANAVVYLKEDVSFGDFLFDGVSVVADPTAVVGSREIQGFTKKKQLKGSFFERVAFLNARTS